MTAVPALLAAALLVLVASPARAACPNESFRTGMSAHLPDCRAYELVTPASNTSVYLGEFAAGNKFDNLFATEDISESGESAIFYADRGTLTAPPGGASRGDGFQAVRTPSGWQTVRLMKPQANEAFSIDSGGVSGDHRYTFVHVGIQEENPYPLEVEGSGTYLGKPDGTYELLGVGALGEQRSAGGKYISPDGSHIIFTTEDSDPGCVTHCEPTPLEPNAPPAGTPAIYDRGPDGLPRVVSLLPGDVTPAGGEGAAYAGASRDGSDVVFTIGNVMYVRINGTETKQVVDAGPRSNALTFGGISRDGSQIFYLVGENRNVGDLYDFDTASGTSEQAVTTGDAELVNVSADGSHVYFVSHQVIGGAPAVAEQPNLYVWSRAGGIAFIATLSPGDVSSAMGTSSLTSWTTNVVSPESDEAVGPGFDPSRTTPDGSVLIFESAAELSGYPNAEHREVYRYETGSGTITCPSCNPGGMPASSDARLEAAVVGEAERPPIDPQSVIYNLSADGSRVFFETSEALVREDVDGINDVYEWSNASGTPHLSLISSGRTRSYPGGIPGFFEFSEPTNSILGITPSGDDVMFGTWERLVEDSSPEGVQAIYDARIGGGFASPLDEPCSGEACQAASSPSSLAEPRSDVFHGHGNVKRKRCRGKKKGTRRRYRACRALHHPRHRHGNRKHHAHRRNGRDASKTGGGK